MPTAIFEAHPSSLHSEECLSQKRVERDEYTFEEDQFILEILRQAYRERKRLTVPQITRALNESSVAIKTRSPSSIRAHLACLLREPALV